MENWYNLDTEDAIKKLETSEKSGLSSEEASRRLEK